jgi:hypothetical protein
VACSEGMIFDLFGSCGIRDFDAFATANDSEDEGDADAYTADHGEGNPVFI